MIRLENVSKRFYAKNGYKTIADDVSITFPRNRSVALLGRNGAGKSSLLKMIAGSLSPDSGKILCQGTVSWPVGFAGSFHQDLTGLQNTRFIARVYGVDTEELVDFVKDFSELGQHFNMPCRSYSSGMRSRLAFGISMGIRFDTYLVDEVTAVGDAAFREKCNIIFAERMKESGAILVTHSARLARLLCTEAVILENGHCTYYKGVDAAIRHHRCNMGL